MVKLKCYRTEWRERQPVCYRDCEKPKILYENVMCAERGLRGRTGRLEFPVFLDGLDGPLELLAQGLGEEFLNGDIELLAEDDR